MFIEILFKMLLFKGGVLIYAEHCICIYIYIYIYIYKIHSTVKKLSPKHCTIFGCPENAASTQRSYFIH